MNRLVLVAIIVIVLGAGLILLLTQTKPTLPQLSSSPLPSDSAATSSADFANPKKSAHYETNTPKHAEILAGVPINVVIDFNFDLAKPSAVSILKDGQDYGVGETVIDQSKLTLRRAMDATSPNGVYQVKYNACWPDASCHDGFFQFEINSNLSSGFTDSTGQKEITINMKDLKFMPAKLRISKGTKVTWVNDDSVIHYVNTDSHPAHTYYLTQNSKALNQGDQFSLTFDQAGVYPYHCSAHEAVMKGTFLVE